MDGDPDLPQLDCSLNNGSNVEEKEKRSKKNHLNEEKWRKHSQMFSHISNSLRSDAASLLFRVSVILSKNAYSPGFLKCP